MNRTPPGNNEFHTSAITRIVPGQHGIALVLVLWMVGLLAIIAGSFVYSARTGAVQTANIVDLARARALSQAGVERGIFELLKPETDGDRWLANGRLNVFELDGGVISVSMRDEAAKIDINTAPDALIKGLFLSSGLDDDDATRLLDAVVDWRDADDFPRAAGAEKDQYEAAGLNYVPANAQYRTVQELQYVLGMKPDFLNKIRNSLTVYSGQRTINSTLSPREVLMACPGATAENVDSYLAYRDVALEQGVVPDPFILAASFGASSNSMAYNVRSAVKLGAATLIQEAIVRIRADKNRSFLILYWD